MLHDTILLLLQILAYGSMPFIVCFTLLCFAVDWLGGVLKKRARERRRTEA